MEKISLDGEWILKNSQRDIEISAEIPGSVFETLIKNNIIEDPFYGLNEDKVSWVYNSNWEYYIDFDIPANFLNYSNIILRFYGLDTLAIISLNDKIIGSAENMFLYYDFNVNSILKSTSNILKVVFKSPTINAEEEIKKLGINLNTGETAIQGVPYLRKAQYSFGWDWGPKLPDIGIWKSVELIGFDNLKISSIYPIQRFEYFVDPLKIEDLNDITINGVKSVNLLLKIEINSEISDISSLNYRLKVDLKAPDGILFNREIPLDSINLSVEFQIEYPYLWWTNGLGTPNLYEITIQVFGNELIDSYTKRIGIRDLRLIRNHDEWGESFYFLLNGVPIFAKGANWIPIDSFISRGKKKELYRKNLMNAKNANMNMIRVWGGGIYEDDEFYDLCDELGILIWQDFPFACAIYPYNSSFIENVKNEVVQNIKRLRTHASLALWCGNNEIEWLWKFLLIESNITDSKVIEEFKEGYTKIFEKIFPKLIETYDPEHYYWASSPSNGIVGNNLGIIDSNSQNMGDSHYWLVWHSGLKFAAYRKFYSRFMSEFGYESLPSIKTLKEICPHEQLEMFSPIIENHQKNPAGNKKLIKYMKKRFLIPNNFQKQIYLSQITQAEAMEYGVEHWRRNRNKCRCMGSLYWQLNDCWPVISWSSIDYLGRWKALHYLAKRFYRPLIPSIKENLKSVEFYIINDLRTSCDVLLEWKILNSKGLILMEGSMNGLVKPCSSLNVGKIDVSKINSDKEKRQNNIIFYKLKDKERKEIIFHGFRLFDSPKYFNLVNPELTYDFNYNPTNKEIQIIVKSKKIALYVFIDSNFVDFIASDNFFSMEPTEIKIITLGNIQNIEGNHGLDYQEIINSIKIQSLYDLMQS